MNNAVVLLSIFGGLASFGISGFIIGPILAALFISLWMIFEEKYRTQLRRK
jgi:predicted PurR-regulated permease PerM